jgi:hypothetical protein
VDYVTFGLAPDSEYKGICLEMKDPADAASKAFVDAIKEKYPVVSEPRSDVARVRFAIGDPKQSRPVINVINSVAPVSSMNISVDNRGLDAFHFLNFGQEPRLARYTLFRTNFIHPGFIKITCCYYQNVCFFSPLDSPLPVAKGGEE